jgi:hypothetical protein
MAAVWPYGPGRVGESTNPGLVQRRGTPLDTAGVHSPVTPSMASRTAGVGDLGLERCGGETRCDRFSEELGEPVAVDLGEVRRTRPSSESVVLATGLDRSFVGQAGAFPGQHLAW